MARITSRLSSQYHFRHLGVWLASWILWRGCPLFALRNHRGTLNFPAAVEAYLTSEDYLGRVAGPFDALPVDDAFFSSLPTSVPKRDSSERRVIVDLSWPCGRSVNDGIPRNSFFGDPVDLTYPIIDDIVDAVVSLGRGCLLYKRDLRKAYRVSSPSIRTTIICSDIHGAVNTTLTQF